METELEYSSVRLLDRNVKIVLDQSCGKVENASLEHVENTELDTPGQKIYIVLTDYNGKKAEADEKPVRRQLSLQIRLDPINLPFCFHSDTRSSANERG